MHFQRLSFADRFHGTEGALQSYLRIILAHELQSERATPRKLQQPGGESRVFRIRPGGRFPQGRPLSERFLVLLDPALQLRQQILQAAQAARFLQGVQQTLIIDQPLLNLAVLQGKLALMGGCLHTLIRCKSVRKDRGASSGALLLFFINRAEPMARSDYYCIRRLLFIFFFFFFLRHLEAPADGRPDIRHEQRNCSAY